MIQYASLKEAWGLHGNGSNRVSTKTACARPSPDSGDKERPTPCCPPQDPMEMLYNASKNGHMDVDGDFAAYYNDVKPKCDAADVPPDDKHRAQCQRPELRPYEVPDPPSARYSYVDARPVYPEKVVAPKTEGFRAGPCTAYGEDLPPELYDEYAKAYGDGIARKHRVREQFHERRGRRFREEDVEEFHEGFEDPPPRSATTHFPPASSPLLSALLTAPVPRIVDALLYVFSGIVFIFMLEQAITLASVVRVGP